MAGLEDRFLKKNIPGKYSWWDDDDKDDGGSRSRHHRGLSDDFNHDGDDHHDNNNNNDNHQSGLCPQQLPPVMSPHGTTTTTTTSRNTGIKGVLHDKHVHDRQLAQTQREYANEQAKITRIIGEGAELAPGQIAMSLSAMQERKQKQQEQCKQVQLLSKREKLVLDSESSSDENEDGDDEFMQAYREKRLHQLQQLQQQQQQTQTNLPQNHNSIPPTTHSSSSVNHENWPRYGEIKELRDKMELAQMIDETDPRVFVIVHLYEPRVQECSRMNTILERLARSMSYARFCRIRALQIMPQIDLIALPLFMIYQGGQLLHDLTRISDLLSSTSTSTATTTRRSFAYDEEDVRLFLQHECGVVDPWLLISSNGNTQEERRGMRVGMTKVEDEYDSEDAELDALCADFHPSVS